MPFETLDTTSRCLTRHGGDVLLSDTVGFIRRLPERLLASFESTLAEMVEASLLVSSSTWPTTRGASSGNHAATSSTKIGAADVPRFYVFNQTRSSRSAPLPSRMRATGAKAIRGCAAQQPRRRSHGRPRGEAHPGRSSVDEEELTIFVPYTATESSGSIYRPDCRVLTSIATERGRQSHIQAPRATTARIRKRSRGGAIMTCSSRNFRCNDSPRPAVASLFDGLNLRIGREHVALMGRNGVGKSTLLAVLAGSVEASEATSDGAAVHTSSRNPSTQEPFVGPTTGRPPRRARSWPRNGSP